MVFIEDKTENEDREICMHAQLPVLKNGKGNLFYLIESVHEQ